MASAEQEHVGPLPEPLPRYTFLATHFTAGNSTFSEQLFYGISETLSPPEPHTDRPQSTVMFDMFARKVVIEVYCDRCKPYRVSSTGNRDGISKKAMWPFRAEIPWEDLQTRGMRLDLSDGLTDNDDEEIWNLRINLRRPPLLWYTYPPAPNQRQSWNGGPRRVYDRRATEEDYIAIDATADWGRERNPDGSEGDGRKMTVLGLPTTIAFFKPGNWLSYQISLKLDKMDVSTLKDLLKNLRLTSPYPAAFAESDSLDIPDSLPLPPNPQSLLSSIVRYPFPMRYLFEGLISYGIVAPEDLTTLTGQLATVPDESQAKREKLLACLFSMGKISGRIPMVVDEVRQKLAASAPAKPLRPHIVLVRRAIVTPTRLLLRPPAEETSNHVLREHADKIDRFLRVQFTDENDSIHYKSIWDDTGRGRNAQRNPQEKWCPGYGMIGRMRRVMDEGLKFSGRTWVYLAAGGSQLKERQVWFICEDEDKGFTAQKLRDWMGDFTKERSIAKHCARISQSFSTTREVKVRLALQREDDILNKPYIFTDGVGRTSQALVSKAAQVLLGEAAVLSKYSAVQIRIGGAKGMLAAWPSMSKNQVVLRDSMIKYESKHEKFGAVMIASYSPAFLNRQAILLMEALGTKHEALLGAFERQLTQVQGLRERAASDKKSPDFEMTHFPIQKLVAAGLGSDPFVRDSIMLLQTIMLWDLKWKARIKVDKGVYLFGVADELRVLEEDEVFCSYANPYDVNQAGVVEGDCIISRAPALHPGDIRRVKAVRHPKLIEAGLVNVIIFPVKGRRDLANKLAGGDLDGDTFTLVWDPDLLTAKNEAPSDYTAPTPPRLVDRVELEHIKEWFIDYFKSDVLGHISNAHMAIADQKGPRCEECIQLAHLASDAVDFQKTGVAVEMPRELRHMARRRPDFMGGSWQREMTYESPNILGQMFRMVEKEPSFERHTDVDIHPVLGALQVPDEFLVAAWKTKLEYELDVVGFMRQYMLSEIEVATGLVAGMAVPPERRKNMMKDDALKLSIRDAFQVKLLEVYQRNAAEWAETKPVPPSFHSATECFAVAAYQLVYDSKARERAEFLEDDLTVVGAGEHLGPDGSPSEDLFSFCWLWADELANALFRRANQPANGKGRDLKRKRTGLPEEVVDVEDSDAEELETASLDFAPIPARWHAQRKKAKVREGGWVNVEDDDIDEDEQAVRLELARPGSSSADGGQVWVNDDDEAADGGLVDDQQSVIEIDSDDEEPVQNGLDDQAAWVNDDGSDDDQSDDGAGEMWADDGASDEPAAGADGAVWVNIEDSADEATPRPAARAELAASGTQRLDLAADDDEEDEIYRQSDWRSPVSAARSAPSRSHNHGQDDGDEPQLPSSPSPEPAALSTRRLPTPIELSDSEDEGAEQLSPQQPHRPQSVVDLADSDEELYGEGTTNDDPWVNDEGTDEDW